MGGLNLPAVTADELLRKLEDGDPFVLVDALAPMVYAHSREDGRDRRLLRRSRMRGFRRDGEATHRARLHEREPLRGRQGRVARARLPARARRQAVRSKLAATAPGRAPGGGTPPEQLLVHVLARTQLRVRHD